MSVFFCLKKPNLDYDQFSEKWHLPNWRNLVEMFSDPTFTENSMADYREVVLQAVDESGEVDTLSLAKKLGVDHQVLVGAVKSLQSLGNVSHFCFGSVRCRGRTSKCYIYIIICYVYILL